MKVHGQDAVRPRRFEEVGHQAGGDRDAGPVLPVLPGVAVIGDDGRDPLGRGPLEGVDHEEELHEMEVGVVGAALDDEDVLAADVLVDVEMDLAVAEAVQDAVAQVDLEIARDLAGEARVR